MNSALRLIVAAGGTGGDFFPAVAVLEQLQKRVAIEALFVGNPERIEAQLAPKLGYGFEGLSVRGYKGITSIDSYLLPFRILGSTLKVRSLISSFRPQLALCAGTYISYPLAMAASLADLPLVLIESNAIPGKANRSVARRADLIIAAFEECRQSFETKNESVIKVLGNPIRNAFAAMPSRQDAAAAFGLDPERRTLLVFGGSLGARSINACIADRLSALSAEGLQVIWQTGKNYSAPDQLPSGVKVLPFIDDMASAYAAADLVLCRAGGGTVAELKVVAKPALLVPYPHAANNEQEHNALSLERAGAAFMIRDSELARRFDQLAWPLLRDPKRLAVMAGAMGDLGRPNAASDAADAVLELLGS